MAKSFFRFLGGIRKKNGNNKRAIQEPTEQPVQPVQRVRLDTSSMSPRLNEAILTTVKPTTTTDKEDRSHYLLNDKKDNLFDINSLVNVRSNNNGVDVNLYLTSVNNLKGPAYNNVKTESQKFLTSSSSTSSTLSLQDELASHFSNTDAMSEITTYSDYKIIGVTRHETNSTTTTSTSSSALASASASASLDRQFSVADNLPTKHVFHDTLSHSITNAFLSQDQEILSLENQLFQCYMEALRHLNNTTEKSPARAFILFEFIASEGCKWYTKLNSNTKRLVSFAQYRAGRMFCECFSDEDITGVRNDLLCSVNIEKMKAIGIFYLNEASKNGNYESVLILGRYAEQRGDIVKACQLYNQAAKAGIIAAKFYFGNTVLLNYSTISEFNAESAIQMLNEAANEGHPFACLSLAIYYEKIKNYNLAIQYCEKVNIHISNPLYCMAFYQISIIYLKAGPDYDMIAFSYMQAVVNALRSKETISESPKPLLKLGLFTLIGIGTQQNLETAFKLIKEASDYGDEIAIIIVAQMYWMGLGVEINLSNAMETLTRYQDNIAVKLSRALLMMDKNPEYAYRELKQVIDYVPTAFDEENWNIDQIKNEARVRIAVWEYNGIGGTKKNPRRAFNTLKRLCDEEEYSGAYYWLAWAYLDSVKLEDGTEIVAANSDLEFEYLYKGAKKNKANCQYRIGNMLREGYQHPKYPELQKRNAFKFFLEAAKADYAPALTAVGVYYYSGIGMEDGPDRDVAFYYFNVAAKKNDKLAIQYLADYIINNISINSINHVQIYNDLIRTASEENDPISYRMLALIVDSGIDPTQTFETSNSNHDTYDNLVLIYNQAKQEAIEMNTDIKLRFTLQCLWKAIELKDVQSGKFLSNYISRMGDEDIYKSIDVFEKAEGPIASKMSFALGHFLKATKNLPLALKKYIAVSIANEVSTKLGWSARLEVAELILINNEGKARSKTMIFKWLSEMITFSGNNLFTPFILLGKCHENEICDGCTRSSAATFYERGLQCKKNDPSLEIFARMRLVEIYYKMNNDRQLATPLETQVDTALKLVNALHDSSDKNTKLSELYYYKGLLILHDEVLHDEEVFNCIEAMKFLSKADKLGNILATLELGYLYGTMKNKEDLAEDCFTRVENSKATPITFKNRLIEAFVQTRNCEIYSEKDYTNKINEMKLAAGITYSYYNMKRQAIDWLNEISNLPVAGIMKLYYDMNDISQRTTQNINKLTNLIDPFEKRSLNDTYDSMAISYAQFRLGQCYQHGHGVAIDNNKASDFYNKACVFLLNNETYERLAEITNLVGSDTNLFTTLLNAAREDTNATFKMGQYYDSKNANASSNQDPDVPCEKAAYHYRIAAQSLHAESCYYYAKYLIANTVGMNAASRSKSAANYLHIAASKNHAASYYELGKLEIKAGLYEEGVEDLKEASFLNHGLASYELGELYYNGFTGIIAGQTTYMLPSSPSDALLWYKKATENGCILSLIREGFFYETGELGNQNLDQAKKCYMKAYESKKCPEGMAEYALGCLEERYASVSGVAPTSSQHKIAFEWFQKALKAKNPNAKFKIGSYLLQGWFVQTCPRQDEERGRLILSQETTDGNVLAIKELARYYEKRQDFKHAFELWCKAGNSDDPDALEYLAECFAKGLLGQNVNQIESSRYKSLASEARKLAIETQRSMMGFKSNHSEEKKLHTR